MADYRPSYLPPKSPSGMVKLFRWTALTLGIFWGIIRKGYLKEREIRIREIQAEQRVFIDAKKKMIKDKTNRQDMELLNELSGMEKEPNFDELYPLVRDEDVKKVCADDEKFIADHKDEEGVEPLEEQPEALQKLCLGEDMEPKSPDESSREPPSGKKRPPSGESCPPYDEDDDDDDDDDEYEWVWTKWFSGKQKIVEPMELYQHDHTHSLYDRSKSTEVTRDNEGWFGVEGFLTSKKPTTSGQMKSHDHHHHHHENEHQHHLESNLEPPSEIPVYPDEVEDEDETDWFWSKWFIFRRDDHKNDEYQQHLHHHHEHEDETDSSKIKIRSSKAKKTDTEDCPYCRR